ncbi:hypothetical protein BDZ94DRAFT_1370507 [Collybia nuda]|uniref:C2 NT-type domain-containing protein n=1 Tax=Collybia nuda TaxID=64659 RepID=A0A9P6CIE6_9AGAR|nr:hypothetical protein BDZ94DRAFT_1370507 [Collybia nuda]
MSAHHLILSNPFTDSSSEDDPAAISSTPTSVLRAQLHHLMPRHTFFRARIHIHQIANIPLVSGEFGVKWKFKNVHTPSGTKQGGILGMVKSKSAKGKGKEENDDDDEGDSNSQGSGDQQPSQLLSAEWKPPSTPSSTVFSSTVSSRTAVSSGASTYTASSRSSSSSAPFSQVSSTAFSASTASSGLSSSSTGNTTPSNSPGSGTSARGQTPFLPLKDHGVTWDHTLDVLLRMDVERDTLDLLSSPLTLTVVQAGATERSLKPKGTSNGNASGTSRLGVVYLDLAQYAGKGEVGRRYLLRNSRTNATLKLTVSVTHASGPSEFHAPPLPKGEISNGISEILEENEVYRTRPRGLNLYGPYEDQEELEIDLLGAKAKGKAKEGSHTEAKHKHSRTISSPTPIFDPERLPHAYGPKTTETLIEALFNPVAVGERRRESPFTVFVDPGSPPLSPTRPLINGTASPALGMAGMKLRSPTTPPAAGPGAGASKGTRPTPTRSGSGIGAGLGIMGLGMGMGIGMGVGVGVTGGRGSMDSRRPSQDGAGRSSMDRRSPINDMRRPSTATNAADRRQPSQGAASVWSTGTDMSGVSADISVESGSSSGHGKSTLGHERNVSFDSMGSPRKKGMKGWFKRKMGSRPGTPTAGLAY